MITVPVVLWVIACLSNGHCDTIKIDEVKSSTECTQMSQVLLPQWQEVHPQYIIFKKIGCSRVGHEPIELRSDPT